MPVTTYTLKNTLYSQTVLVSTSSTTTMSSMSGHSITDLWYNVTPIAPASPAYLTITFGGGTADTVFTLSGTHDLSNFKFATCPRNAVTPDGTINLIPTNAIYTAIMTVVPN